MFLVIPLSAMRVLFHPTLQLVLTMHCFLLFESVLEIHTFQGNCPCDPGFEMNLHMFLIFP